MEFGNLFILFWLYAFLGWVVETTWVSFKTKKFINRGFFIGPYCPIYGTGAILLSLLNISNQYHPFIIFIIAVFVCSVVEYLTSYFLELIYRVRWWDYSDNFFNINGRICLFNAFCFGFLGTIVIYYLNPLFINIIGPLSNNIKIIIIVFILIITFTDIIVTFNAMYDIKKSISNIKDKTLTNIFKNKDNTEEISKKIKNILKQKSFIHKHISTAYSNLKVYRNNFIKKGGEIIKYRKWQNIENSYVLVSLISIFIGIILNIIFNNSFFVIISFVLGIIIVKLIIGGKYGK